MSNLYLITQTVDNDYDYGTCGTYDSAVVVANSEEEARKIHPGGDCGGVFSWAKPEDVTVCFLGTLGSPLWWGRRPGGGDWVPGSVVCASHNQG